MKCQLVDSFVQSIGITIDMWKNIDCEMKKLVAQILYMKMTERTDFKVKHSLIDDFKVQMKYCYPDSLTPLLTKYSLSKVSTYHLKCRYILF